MEHTGRVSSGGPAKKPCQGSGDPLTPGQEVIFGLSSDIGVYEYRIRELELKLILSGAYVANSGLMGDGLRANNLIPTSNPWGRARLFQTQYTM